MNGPDLVRRGNLSAKDALKVALANALKQDRVYRYAQKFELNDDWISHPEGCLPAHYVLIRFNLYDELLRAKAGLLDTQAYDEWTLCRARMFAETAQRSLKAQTVSNFKVLVLMDVEMNDGAEALLSSLPSGGTFVPLQIDQRGREPFAKLEEEVRRYIQSTAGNANVIATTRLDSDDAVSVGFMELLNLYTRNIRAEALQSTNISINFPFGLQVSDGVFRVNLYNRNPFQTLLEPRSRYDDENKWTRKTIFQFAHDRSDKNCLVQNATTSQPMWLQIVHGGNVANRPTSHLPEVHLTPLLDEMFGGIPTTLSK